MPTMPIMPKKHSATMLKPPPIMPTMPIMPKKTTHNP